MTRAARRLHTLRALALLALPGVFAACGGDDGGPSGPADDTTPPTLHILSPSASSFDTNGNGRVDVRVTYGDVGSGVNTASLSVITRQSLGGGAARGGADANTNLASLITDRTANEARWDAALTHEFGPVQHTIVVSIADNDGNTATDSVIFTPPAQKPIVSWAAPTNGATVAGAAGFQITVNFTERAGIIDPTTFTIRATRAIGGAFDDATRTVSTLFGAGTDLAPTFTTVTEMSATLTVPDSLTFRGGSYALVAAVSDRVGNRDSASVTFNVPTPAARLFLPDTAVGAAPDTFDVTLEANLVEGLLAADGTITYDAAVLQAISATPVGLGAGMTSSFNLGVAGEVRFALATATAVSGDGGLFSIRFVSVGPGTTALALPELRLNEGQIAAELTAGEVSVP